MGTLQNSINSKRAEIQRLSAEVERIEENYGNKPQFENFKRNALRPLNERITRLELDVREIEASFEFANEQDIDAMFAEAREERALEARREKRAAAEQAEIERYDTEIAQANFKLSGLKDLPRMWNGKPLVSPVHRNIARGYFAERARRAEQHERLNHPTALEVFAEAAAEHGMSATELQSKALERLEPINFEQRVAFGGQHYVIWADDQGVVVERDHKRNIEAALGGSDTGNGDGQ